MANVLIENDTMRGIADAIREKDGSLTTMLPSDMADKILAIPTNLQVGQFVLPSAYYIIQISHNLGNINNAILYFWNTDATADSGNTNEMIACYANTPVKSSLGYTLLNAFVRNTEFNKVSGNYMIFYYGVVQISTPSESQKFEAGTYNFILYKIR